MSLVRNTTLTHLKRRNNNERKRTHNTTCHITQIREWGPVATEKPRTDLWTWSFINFAYWRLVPKILIFNTIEGNESYKYQLFIARPRQYVSCAWFCVNLNIQKGFFSWYASMTKSPRRLSLLNNHLLGSVSLSSDHLSGTHAFFLQHLGRTIVERHMTSFEPNIADVYYHAAWWHRALKGADTQDTTMR